MAKRILLVDDEPLIVKGLKYTLEQEGFVWPEISDDYLSAYLTGLDTLGAFTTP